MIKLTKLNGDVFYLNYFQILSLENIPETKVRMHSGEFYLVQDSVDSILQKSRSFLHECVFPESPALSENFSQEDAR